ncbi:hypothetical protein ACLMJK_008224 [Lecanora helva]
MDQDTIDLIMELHLEDLGSLRAQCKGKGKESDVTPDNEVAIDLQEAELKAQKALLADFRLAASISRAVQDDGAMVAILMADERRCAQDRETACRMGGQHHAPPNTTNHDVDDDLISRLGSINFRQDQDEDFDDGFSDFTGSIISLPQQTGESSAWAANRAGSTKYECVACLNIQDTIQMPCQHRYCKNCVVQLVTDALIDETLYPPRCCRREMPKSLLRRYLTFDLAAKWEQKAIEFGTPCRTYCYSCSLFINPAAIRGYLAHCNNCNLDTCLFCGGRFHEGNCPKDPALERVLQVAQEAGWQRCTECQNMIERYQGCNHITCRCGHNFCYECGQKWKTCTCIVYDEDMLLQRARHVARRDAAPGARAPAAGQIRAIANNLRERHDCDHQGRWRKVDGPHQCEECHTNLREYILQCRQCMLQACVRCKRNRL